MPLRPELLRSNAKAEDAPLVQNLTRDEIIQLVQLASGPTNSQEYYVELLDKALPNAEVSNLIFWPDRERTSTEIADEALLRCALVREGGLAALRARLVALANEVRANPVAPAWAQHWARGYREG